MTRKSRISSSPGNQLVTWIAINRYQLRLTVQAMPKQKNLSSPTKWLPKKSLSSLLPFQNETSYQTSIETSNKLVLSLIRLTVKLKINRLVRLARRTYATHRKAITSLVIVIVAVQFRKRGWRGVQPHLQKIWHICRKVLQATVLIFSQWTW